MAAPTEKQIAQMNTDFRKRRSDEIVAELKTLSKRKRRKTARALIYKKNQRPEEKSEQIALLAALRGEEALTDFDRSYALIAGAHKVCERVDIESAPAWLNDILGTEAQIRAMPIGFGLRKDRTHLVFSFLNIALNLDLLTGSHHSIRLGDWFMEELENLNPKRMTPYLFNSTSNIMKCAGIAALSRPAAAGSLALLMRKLISYSIEINNFGHWWIHSRFRAPSKVSKISERAAFGEHCRTIVRLSALEAAAEQNDAALRAKLLKETAYLCVAQATDQQREALRKMVAQSG